MKLKDPAFLFQGHHSLEMSEGGTKPWRLPHMNRELFPSPEDQLMARAELAAGVRLIFRTDGDRIILCCKAESDDPDCRFDLTQDGVILRTVSIAQSVEKRTVEIPLSGKSDRPYRLWLPHFSAFTLYAVEFPGAGQLEVPRDNRPLWLTYGSSITQCRQAGSPAGTWPAVASRILDLNMISMGFGGQCHLDGMVARVIRDSSADIITLKLGINVMGGESLNARSYLPAVINLIHTIREKHPRTSLGVISPIYCGHRESAPNGVGADLRNFRRWDREAVEIFRKRGDRFIEYFDGLEMFGPDQADLLPDNLHPNTEGYEIMGKHAAEVILPRLLAMRD